MKLFVAALLGVALLAPLTVQSAAADPLPGLCPDKTAPAAPYAPNGGWALVNVPYVDIYAESNGVAGLQTQSCVTVDGVSAPADTWTGRIFLPVCFTVLGNHICIV